MQINSITTLCEHYDFWDGWVTWLLLRENRTFL